MLGLSWVEWQAAVKRHEQLYNVALAMQQQKLESPATHGGHLYVAHYAGRAKVKGNHEEGGEGGGDGGAGWGEGGWRGRSFSRGVL